MLIYAQVNSAFSSIASLKLASVLQFLAHLHEFTYSKIWKIRGGKFVGWQKIIIANFEYRSKDRGRTSCVEVYNHLKIALYQFTYKSNL